MVADFAPAGTRADLPEETSEQAEAVRLQYFSNKPHSWFTPMQMILRAMNLSWSYAEGTAVNLDIVACATNPSFGDLAANVRTQMAQNCRSFLVETLSAFPDGIWIVVNGKGAFDGLKEAVEMVPNNAYTQNLPNQQIQVFVGELHVNRKRFPYFAWNIYLHYSRMNQAGALVDFWHKLPRLL